MEMWETKAEGSDAVGPKLYQARQGMNLSLTSFRVWILWPNGKDMLPRLLKFLRNYPDYQMDIGWPTPLSTQQCARWGHHFTFCNYQQTFHPSSLSLSLLGATFLKNVLLRYISCLSIISYLCPSSLGLPWIPGISLSCQSHYYPCKGLNAWVSHGLIQKWTQIAVISSTEQPTGIYSIGDRSLRSSPADTPFPLFSLMKNLFSPCSWWSTRWVWIALSFCPQWGDAWKWPAPEKAHCYSSTVIVTARLSSFFSHVSHTSFPPVPIHFKWKMLRTIRQAKNKRAVSPRRKTACSCCCWFTLISPLGPFNTSHTLKGRIKATDEAWTMRYFSALVSTSPTPLLQTP